MVETTNQWYIPTTYISQKWLYNLSIDNWLALLLYICFQLYIPTSCIFPHLDTIFPIIDNISKIDCIPKYTNYISITYPLYYVIYIYIYIYYISIIYLLYIYYISIIYPLYIFQKEKNLSSLRQIHLACVHRSLKRKLDGG